MSRLALVLLLAALPVPALSQPEVLRRQMLEALALLEAGDPDAAIPRLLAVVDAAPGHGPARLQLGAIALDREEWRVAADHLRAAVASVGPEAAEDAVPVQRPGLAWTLLADALAAAGDLEEALEASGRAVRLAPAYVPGLLRRSAVARRLAAARGRGDAGRTGFLEIALEAARGAADAAPERPGPWAALARAARNASLPDLARCAAERARALAPDDPRVLFLFGRVFAATDPEAALEAAEAALAGGLRDEPAVWMAAGELRAFRMDLEGSLAAYGEALRLDPAAAGEMASLALDTIAAGGNPELVALLRERARSRPDAWSARFALARVDLRAGRPMEAAAALRRLARDRPDHPAVLTALHAALRQTGDGDGAAAVRVRLAAVQAAEAEAWDRANAAGAANRRAREAATGGDHAGAAASWQELFAHPDRPPPLPEDDLTVALAGFAAALDALGRPDEARAVAERALRLHPFDPAALAVAARLSSDPERGERYRSRARLAAADCVLPARP